MTSKQKRILIVDDEPFILKSLQRTLEDSFNVKIALGGRAALDVLALQEDKFDIILSDISMPDIDGADLYHQIENKYPGLEKNIIFMSGGAYNDVLKSFIANVDNLFLEKPFQMTELIAVIDKHSMQ